MQMVRYKCVIMKARLTKKSYSCVNYTFYTFRAAIQLNMLTIH